ncbi:MAG: ATP-binding cassette domain-containing protein, partial [Oscillospiraceae bacterium]|nr:ATP-binding cassette domain-containing protein [Oscillospiraceae bacterium]
MLQIRHLTLTHRKDLRVILRDFNLVLNRGDKAVIIGEEGNGKSTLLKWIYDPALVSDYIEAEGERTDQGERIGYLPQELPEAYKEQTVCEYFSGWDRFWDQTPGDLRRMAAKLHISDGLFYSDQRMGT